MGLHRDFDLQPVTDPGDPDDWRPNSIWTLVAERSANVAIIIEEIGVGDAIPLHRHQVDEVLLYDSGAAEVRVDEETYRVQAGDIVIVPAGAAHGTRNVGPDKVSLRAVFPSHRIHMTYLERNPAPGTDGDAPQPGVVWDTRSGEVQPL